MCEGCSSAEQSGGMARPPSPGSKRTTESFGIPSGGCSDRQPTRLTLAAQMRPKSSREETNLVRTGRLHSVNEAGGPDEARRLAVQRVETERALQHVFDVVARPRHAVERVMQLSWAGRMHEVGRGDHDYLG